MTQNNPFSLDFLETQMVVKNGQFFLPMAESNKVMVV